MSGELVRILSKAVDFLIGHGSVSVGDADAIKCTSTLYRGLGSGLSLWASFNAAKLSSKPYTLLSSRFDPAQFFLQGQQVSLLSGPESLVGPSRDSGHAPFGSSSGAEVGERVSDGAAAEQEKGWLELAKFLAKHGLYNIKDRLRDDLRLGVHTVPQLGFLFESDLEVVEWLSAVQRRTLVKICQKVAADSMSGAMDDGRSDASGADTEETPSGYSSGVGSGGSVVVAARHAGSVDDVELHLQQLSRSFTERTESSFCQLVLMAFLRGATFSQHADLQQACNALCQSEANEIVMLGRVAECLDSMSVQHDFLGKWQFKESMLGCAKKHLHVSAVFVIDCMIRESEAGGVQWSNEVVGEWFTSEEDSRGFLDRANQYLAARAWQVQRFLQAVPTQSYCVFLSVSKLTALLFFEQLEARKRHANAVHGTELGLDGFRLFVSSDRQIVSVAQHDIPSQRSLGVVHRGLQCLAGLPRESLERMLVPLVVNLDGGEARAGQVPSAEAASLMVSAHPIRSFEPTRLFQCP